jgi:hypothetical protein
MTPSQAPLLYLGTWKLTDCRSTRPELPHPISGIVTFAMEQDALRYHNEGAWSDGRTVTVNAAIPLDGTWCPVAGSLLSDSLSFRSMDAGFEIRMRKNGADIGMTRSTVSADGRTMTGGWELLGPDGKSVTWTTILDRQ